MAADPDVLVVGGGHNGLVAAAYLAAAGRQVTVLEANPTFGGAVAGARLFDGVDATLSRYSYLVSLLPDVIIDDLGLDLELRSRRIGTFTPVRDGGVIIDRGDEVRTRASIRTVTGDPEAYDAWQRLHAELEAVARLVAPTLTLPLPRAGDLAARLPADVWSSLTERPIGDYLERHLTDDTLRGIVLTDALIGIDSWAHDPTLRQNRCLLYHVIGNGTGEWRVAVGGMAAVAGALERAARDRGAELRAGARVTSVEPHLDGVRVELADGSRLQAPVLLANCAPATLARLRGAPSDSPQGAQVKINLVVRRLPRLRADVDPTDGFAGTLHLNQGYDRLAHAYAESRAGRLPDPLPVEVYCHSLTDSSILSPQLRSEGWHTLTMFALHCPARLFGADRDRTRRRVAQLAFASLQAQLAEPLEDCLAIDAAGRPCIEVMVPQDVEGAIGMPGGHIFHGDLAWPWLADDEPEPVTAAQRWGVATDHDRILLCGSGARRGGAVSGIGGHNAAMALLDT